MSVLIKLLAAAALAAAPDVAPPPATDAGPVDFVAPDGTFSARFPNEPQLLDGAWKSRTADRECGVMPIPMERDKDAATSDILLNLMLAQLEQSIHQQGHGGLVSSDTVAFEGKPARGFVTRTGPSDGPHTISKGRLVRTETHVMMILCDSPNDSYDEAAVTAFVDSVRLSPAAK